MSTHNIAGIPASTVASINPATQELLREYDQHSDEAVESKLQLALETFRQYRRVSFAQRAGMMARAAEVLEQSKDKFGKLMTQEMGKTLRSAVQEAEKCAFGCRF